MYLAHKQTRNTGGQLPANTKEPRVVHVDRLNGGIVIAFDDGKTALYPATLLHEILSRTQDVTDLPRDDE